MSTAGVVASRLVRGVGASDSPPPVPSGFTPNEPAGFSTFLDHTFDAATAPSGWSLSEGVNGDLVLGGSGPEHPTSLGLQQANTTPSEGLAILSRTSPTDTRSVYFSMAFRLSSNYVLHSSGMKFIYPYLTGTGRPFEIGLKTTSGRNGGKFRFALFTYYAEPNDSFDNFEDDIGQPDLDVGTWYRWEVLIQNNAVVGDATGRIRWWLSSWTGSAWTAPTLRADAQNLRIVPVGLAGTWGLWEYNFYYGGSGSNPVVAAQQIEINRLYHSTSTTGL